MGRNSSLLKRFLLSILGYLIHACALSCTIFTILKITGIIIAKAPTIPTMIPMMAAASICYASGIIIGKKRYWKKNKGFLIGYDKYYITTCFDICGTPLYSEIYEIETEKWIGSFTNDIDATAFAIKKEKGEMALPTSYPMHPDRNSLLVGSERGIGIQENKNEN